MRRLHDDELAVDVDLVQRLVADAFPALAGRELVPVATSGSSNTMFRLGRDLVVRLPRQPGGGASITKEARWLPYVAGRLPVAVPEVVGVGEPALGYPERWSVTSWLPGAVPRPPVSGAASVRLARDLADLVAHLRAMVVPAGVATDASLSWYRGGPLAALDADVRMSATACAGLGLPLDLRAALRVWDLAVAAEETVEPSVGWYHGDLVAENLLVDRAGRLSAVLDLGGLGVGDPTVDLVVAWEVLDAEGRAVFRRALDVDDATWTVSRGWAVLIGLVTFPYYGATMPQRCADRVAMVQAATRGD
ncbi:aminoglycoside phosphotransferase family protein [Nocardioides sp. SOB77]|uniref:Aminoglycoside phosphotransferase family protein n=1 Tax=Nocardioides oceani TaxID=3058369 RepID=A0ABT8FLZ7_9ACTN|nr:aminoglycoside phosphotransferase family protein [Nocardioides oceani]MDN4175540.1 aminoglycoside phosphotransferase family protein [Nocardioides oceani]